MKSFFITFTWVGTSVKVMAKSRVQGQRAGVKAFFDGADIDMEATDADDLTERDILDKLRGQWQTISFSRPAGGVAAAAAAASPADEKVDEDESKAAAAEAAAAACAKAAKVKEEAVAKAEAVAAAP